MAKHSASVPTMQVAYPRRMPKKRAHTENRRYWLERWIREVGSVAALAELVETTDTYLTAIRKGRRNVGDDLAERLERVMGQEPGAMDGPPSPTDGEVVTDELDFTIMQYDTAGSMGRGLILRDQPGVIKGWRVTPEWIQKNVHNITNARNLAIVTGFGDSMKPMYNPGDPLLVDTGVRSVEFDGVYFFRIGNEGFIKRLQRVPGEGLVAISENKAYKEWTVKDGMDFEVFARVVKVWKGDDF